MPAVAVAMLGPLAVAAAWIVIRRGRGSVWTVMVPVLAALGAASIATGVVRVAIDGDDLAPLLLIGAASGLALYLATRLFLAFAAGWEPLRAATEELYGNEATISLGWAAVLGALVGGPAEELLWRGVVLTMLIDAADSLNPVWAPWIAAAAAWLGYVAANAFSASVPILLAAVVSGAVWTILGLSGVGAPIACHVVWTGLMILAPPRAAGR